MEAFRVAAEARSGRALPDYAALHTWSVGDLEGFWGLVWDFCGVRAETRGNSVVRGEDRMPGAQWFPDARLNFAENLLRRNDDSPAIIAWGENKVSRTLSFAQMRTKVAETAAALAAMGVGPGDRVAGLMPNIPEAVIAMLAAASLGAIWSSCSPDFGVSGVLDRFGQIAPKVLFSTDGYFYAGKVFLAEERLHDILDKLPSVERLVVVPYVDAAVHWSRLRGGISFPDFIAPHAHAPLRFRALPFDHPLYILYSSGTTGIPKCIVHGAGGTLLQHLKEHRLHSDIRRDDRVFYFTTCGWMMWNWLASALASEATIILYDGSPFFPRPKILWDLAEQERVCFFGTSAKYIDAAHKAGLEPGKTHRLDSLRTLASTGSPLVPESFDWVYRAIKQDLCLASISGGTDIVSCFVLGNPLGPVRRGEIQVRGLGMAVEVFDDEGRSVIGDKGELVCTRPFPSMPLGFWNDPEGAKYRAAYFEKFPGIWCHGDWVELTADGGIVIFGRSDAVLNPGGVRIGTSEIYRQDEQVDEVLESLAVGQEWDGDERVILFVKLRPNVELDQALIERIRRQIRENTTPRHMPARIVAIADIPRTKSGKITELAVKAVIHGRPVKNREALANPEALDLYRKLPELSA